MSFNTIVRDAIDRLSSLYNNSGYNPSTNPGGMGFGGHRENFIPALQDLSTVTEAIGDAAAQVAEDTATTSANAATVAANTASATASAATATTGAATATTKAAEAVAAAETAVSTANNILGGLSATSTTSLIVGLGTKSLTVQSTKAFKPGMAVTVAYTPTPNVVKMLGTILTYNVSTGAMTVDIGDVEGTGTYADWTIAIALSDGGMPDVPSNPAISLTFYSNLGPWGV
jgi:hypothetical protein